MREIRSELMDEAMRTRSMHSYIIACICEELRRDTDFMCRVEETYASMRGISYDDALKEVKRYMKAAASETPDVERQDTLLDKAILYVESERRHYPKPDRENGELYIRIVESKPSQGDVICRISSTKRTDNYNEAIAYANSYAADYEKNGADSEILWKIVIRDMEFLREGSDLGDEASIKAQFHCKNPGRYEVEAISYRVNISKLWGF